MMKRYCLILLLLTTCIQSVAIGRTWMRLGLGPVLESGGGGGGGEYTDNLEDFYGFIAFSTSPDAIPSNTEDQWIWADNTQTTNPFAMYTDSAETIRVRRQGYYFGTHHARHDGAINSKVLTRFDVTNSSSLATANARMGWASAANVPLANLTGMICVDDTNATIEVTVQPLGHSLSSDGGYLGLWRVNNRANGGNFYGAVAHVDQELNNTYNVDDYLDLSGSGDATWDANSLINNGANGSIRLDKAGVWLTGYTFRCGDINLATDYIWHTATGPSAMGNQNPAHVTTTGDGLMVSGIKFGLVTDTNTTFLKVRFKPIVAGNIMDVEDGEVWAIYCGATTDGSEGDFSDYSYYTNNYSGLVGRITEVDNLTDGVVHSTTVTNEASSRYDPHGWSEIGDSGLVLEDTGYYLYYWTLRVGALTASAGDYVIPTITGTVDYATQLTGLRYQMDTTASDNYKLLRVAGICYAAEAGQTVALNLTPVSLGNAFDIEANSYGGAFKLGD